MAVHWAAPEGTVAASVAIVQVAIPVAMEAVAVTESKKAKKERLVREGLSVAWTLGLVLFFILVVPYMTWWVADYLDALYLMFVPMGGCLYLVSMADSIDRDTLLPILVLLENPFTKNPDPKASLFLVSLPMLSAGVMLPWFFAALVGVI